MRTFEDLRRTLARIDRRGYKAYRELRGSYAWDGLELHVDHVQGDPFAAPSRVRVRLAGHDAAIPGELASSPVRRLALADFLARRVRAAIRDGATPRRGSGKSGLLAIDAGGQQVLERSAVAIAPEWIEARLEVGLPAAGRTVLGREADALLCRDLPRVADRSLRWPALPQDAAQRFVECVENQEQIRSQLEGRGLVAFVADGAILPRESGASDRPLGAGAVPFRAPDALRVRFELANPIEREQGAIHALDGLGIPKGVTLIVGGGYHGKSTLLAALERGVYPHVPDDGREYVVTSRDAVKIRAEDGRRVERVDIHPFIADLPHGRPTREFSSDDASGSTSQAANIVEALEVGARVLLLDEDTSATNFMVRDARMQALVAREKEPITPFVDRVRELHRDLGVSTVLVMGGCGDYFDVADTVLMMDEYRPHDVTAEAGRVAGAHPTQRRPEARGPLAAATPRSPVAESFDPSRGRREVKITTKGRDLVLFGSDPIDLRHVSQLVDSSQTRAVGLAIELARRRWMDGRRPLREVVDALESFFDERGLDELAPFRARGEHPGNLARPRKYEIAAAINRLRTVRMRSGSEGG